MARKKAQEETKEVKTTAKKKAKKINPYGWRAVRNGAKFTNTK